MKLLIEASEIPLESTVIKRTGTTPYVIRDRIVIYGRQSSQEIPAEVDTRFLICKNGNVSIIPSDVQLLWVTSPEQLLHWLEVRLNKNPTLAR